MNPGGRSNPGRGIALKIASTFVFTVMQAGVKLLVDRVPAGEIIFARSFFELLPVIAVLIWQGQFLVSLSTRKPWAHASRSIVGTVGMSLGFLALAYLPLLEAMTIGYAAPLIVVALSALILAEPVGIYRWSATCIGFIGILVILWPRLSLVGGGGSAAAIAENLALFGVALALAGALTTAFVQIFIRTMTRTESVGSIVIYYSLTGSVLALSTLPFGWSVPTLGDALLLLAVGLLGGIGQMLMTSSYRAANPATVASFEYSSILWGIGLGYLVFDEVPNVGVILGGAIVIAAGVFIVFRERKLGLERKREREAARITPL
jgi:drug/metabolite transporter (DMT)-like permease